MYELRRTTPTWIGRPGLRRSIGEDIVELIMLLDRLLCDEEMKMKAVMAL